MADDTIHKAELANIVSERLGCSRAQAHNAINAVLDSIEESLGSGKRVVITGFGAFETRERAARAIRHIKGVNAGKKVILPSRMRVAFTPGTPLNNTVRNGYKNS